MAVIECRPLPELSAKDIQRFWDKVDRQGLGDCWPWKGNINSRGYGRFGVNAKNYLATRVTILVATGIDPFPLQALHKCDNPPCCNPSHLFVGTHADNMKDAAKKGRARSGAHPGESNPKSKLTEAQVLEIRELADNGEPHQVIADIYGVTFGRVSKIARRVVWTHI